MCCGFPFTAHTPGRSGREGASIALIKQVEQQRSEKAPHRPQLSQLTGTPGLEAEAPVFRTVTSSPCYDASMFVRSHSSFCLF